MMLPAETVLFQLPKWMDSRESSLGPSEVFFCCLATVVICACVYLPWYLRQKKAKKNQI
jgi:uncharacterized protein YecE (DUF72 family)